MVLYSGKLLMSFLFSFGDLFWELHCKLVVRMLFIFEGGCLLISVVTQQQLLFSGKLYVNLENFSNVVQHSDFVV